MGSISDLIFEYFYGITVFSKNALFRFYEQHQNENYVS